MSSNTVDNKTVELQLKNENFEKNAKTSMMTAQRLEKALNFKGLSHKVFDGLKAGAEVGKSGVASLTGAVTGLGSSLDAIKNVAGFTMIANAATDAYNKVTQLVKSMSTDQIGAGFQKYESITKSMQTIMSATEYAYDSHEEQLTDVTRQMEKLNWFADATAFDLNDMTSSVGKFTANKVDLQTATTAIQGIGTWASKSGASVQDASRAMYNLSQAISVGSVKLIDWKSIENANMSTAEFKETAIQTAEELGTLTKVEDGLWKTMDGSEVSATNFNEALQDGWFTSEVLLKSLDKYGNFAVKLNDYSSEFASGFSSANIIELIERSKDGTIDWAKASAESGVELTRLKEIIADLGKEEYEFGMNAFKAAMETKTWTEAIEYTQEAVSSGWMQTFQILFGEYEDAKVLWTKVGETMQNVLVSGITERNKILTEAFNTTEAISKKDWDALEKSGLASPAYIMTLRTVAAQHGDTIDSMVSNEEWLQQALEQGIITAGLMEEAYNGMMDDSNGDAAREMADRISAIAKEDETVQKFLDTLGDYSEEDLEKITFGDHKYAEGYEELESGLDSIIKSLGLTQEESEQAMDALRALGYFGGFYAEGWANYTDEELKASGMTDKQIAKFRELQKEGKAFGDIMKELGIDTTTAGEHWTQGLFNLLDIVNNFKSVFDTLWDEFFPPLEATSIASWLKAFDEGTAKANDWVQNSDTLKNALRAVISVVDVVISNLRMVGEAFAMKGILLAAGKIIGLIGPFLKLTGIIAKGAVAFSLLKGFVEGLGLDWGKLANGVADITQKFTAWFKAADPINKALDKISEQAKKWGQSVRKWFDAFTQMPQTQKGIERLRLGFKLFTEGFSSHMEEGKTRLDAFNKKVEEMGGIRPDNFVEVFKMGKDELVDWLKTFPGVNTAMNGLTFLWKGLKKSLEAIGVPVDKIEKALKTVFGAVKVGLSWALKSIDFLFTSVKKLWKLFMDLPFVGSAIKNFGNAFATIGKTIIPFLDGLPDAFSAFWDRVNSILGDGFQLADVPAIFTAFKEEVLDYIGNWDGFKAIGDAFSNLWKDLTTPIGENKEVQKVFGPIQRFLDELKEALSVIKLPETFDDIPEFLNSIKEAIDGIPKAEGGGWSDMIFNGVKRLLERIVDLSIFITSHWKLALGIVLVAYLFKKIKGIFHDIHEYFNAMTKELKARAFLETAIGVVALAAAIWIVVNTFKDMIELFGKGDSFADNMLHIAPGLLAIVVILGMTAMLFKTVGKMKVEPGTAWGVAAAVAAIWVVAHAFIDFANNLDTGGGFLANMAKITPAIIAMGAAIGLMAGLFFVVGKMKVEKGTAFGIAAAVASLWVVAQAFKSLSKLSWGQIGKGIAALGTVVLGMIGLMVTASLTKVDAKPLIAIASVIAIVSIALGALAYIGTVNPDGLKLAIGALIGVILSLSLLVGLTSKISGKGVASLVLLGVIIGAIAGIVFLLNKFVGVDNTVKIAGSLAALFAGLAILMIAVSVVGKLGLGGLVTGLIGMAAVIVVLGVVLVAVGYLVDKFGVEGYLDKGIETVSKILGVVCEAITGIIQAIGKGLFGDRTPLQMLADDVAYMAEVFGSGTFKDNIDAIGKLNLLSSSGVNLALVAVLSGIFGYEGAIMSIFNLISEMTTGKTAIESVVDDISYLASTIGGSKFAADMANIGRLEMNEGLLNLGKLSVITAIFGAEGAIMSIFNLISEMTTDKTAIESVVDDISYLAATLGSSKFAADLANVGRLNTSDAFANLMDIAGFTAVFGAEGALSTIVDSIIGFATGDKDYDSMDAILDDVTKIADTLGNPDFLAKMALLNTITFPTDNINSLAGSVAIFDTEGALSTIVDSIIGFAIGDEKFSAMDTVLEDIKTLAETLGGEEFLGQMNAFGSITIPTEEINSLATTIGDLRFDGLVSAIQTKLTSWLTDEDKTALESWAGDVETLAGALGTWNTKMAEAGELKVDSDAIDALTKAVGAITKTGGLSEVISQFVTGTVDTAEFEKRVGSLGTAVGKFNEGLGEADTTKLTSASRVLTSLTTIASKFSDFALLLDNASNAEIAFDHITGSINTMVNNIENPDEAVKVGQSAASISTAMSTFAQIKIDGDIVNDDLVTKFEDNVKSIIASIESTANVDTSGVDKVKGAVSDLASTDMGGADTAKQASKLARDEAAKFGSAGEEAGNEYAESLSKSSGAATAAASGMMSAVSGALSDTSAFYRAGLNMGGAVAGGIYTSLSIVAAAASSMATQAASSVDTSGMGYIGYNFVYGFANGIELYTYIAVNKARAMADAAAREVKKVLNEHSPSRVTREFGMFFSEGFGLGIEDGIDSVRMISSDLGESAVNGLNDAVRTINDIIGSNIEADPVVRPVLDLSEIQNGAGNITKMLSAVNMGDPFGSFNTITRSIEAKKSATSLDDVVSALDSVERSTSNIRGGDTYTVNGVTYDDGSNITDAVRTLVNATIVRQRS